MIVTYIRSSSYGNYDFCQMQYFMTYVLGYRSESGKKAQQGTALDQYKAEGRENLQDRYLGEESRLQGQEADEASRLQGQKFNKQQQLEEDYWNNAQDLQSDFLKGEQAVQNKEYNRLQSLAGMADARKQAADQARSAATQGLVSGIGDVAGGVASAITPGAGAKGFIKNLFGK